MPSSSLISIQSNIICSQPGIDGLTHMSSNWLIVTSSMLVLLGMTGRTGRRAPLLPNLFIELLLLLQLLPTKVPIFKAMVFPGVIHGCESWTIKKTEDRRIDTFKLWFLRKLLRVPWTARRSN